MELSIWAIVLSIIVGVVTNIMTPHLSNAFGKLSNSIKVRNEKRKVVFTNTVQYLINNPHEENVFRIRYMQSVLGIGLGLFLAVVMMFSNNPFEIIVGFLLSLQTYYSLIKLNNRRKISEELIKIKKAAHPEINLD